LFSDEEEVYEEEDVYEDEDEVEDTFPDAEEGEYDYEDEDLPTLDVPTTSEFLADPWPKMTFILTVVGFAIAFLVPGPTWDIWVYQIVGNYFIAIIAAVGYVFSMKIWKESGTSRLRYGGPTNLIVIIVCLALATVETISLALTGVGPIPGIVSLTPVALLVMFFSIYSLYAIQRTFQAEV
jgi:hypothetical protein